MYRLVVLAVALSSVTWAAPTSSDLTTNYVTNDGQTRQESVSADGTIFGEYSYVDTNGKLVKVKYSAGKDGFKAIGDHLPVEPAVPVVAPPQSSPVQPQGWNNVGPQQQPALRTPQVNSWNNVPQQQPAPQPLTSQLNPASTWSSQSQPQWNSQPAQAWSQPQSQQLWNSPSQVLPQQQFNAPSQFQPQQQWNVQPQPQWQNQPVTNWQQPQPQPQPWLQNPASRIGQQPQQSAKVNFSQQPGQGFSFSVNS